MRMFKIRYQFFRVVKTYIIQAYDYSEAVKSFIEKTGVDKTKIISVKYDT